MDRGKDLTIAEKKENNKVIERGNVRFGDIKWALWKPSDNKEGCWKYN